MCVRNDLGREFAQSDSLLTHTFSIVAFLIVMNYKANFLFCKMPICDIFLSTYFMFYDNVHTPYAYNTFLAKHVLFNMLICDFVDIPLFVVVKALRSLCLCRVSHVRR